MTGFLLVDKPPGPTSHDVVARARRLLGVKRVGHAGTLDPPASGLVVLGVGPATRLLMYVQRMPKTYEARGVLGVRTTTLDADGEVVSTSPVDVSEDALRTAMAAFVGEIEQVPPAVSAVKVGGMRAYKRAARGEDVRIEPRAVTVYHLDLEHFDPPHFDVTMRCSSGTYVRSLVADIGDSLGCGAHVAMLRRTAIGHLRAEDALPPDEVSSAAVRPVEECIGLPVIAVDADVAGRLGNGQRVPADAEWAGPEGEVAVVGPSRFVGVFLSRDGILRPVTVLGTAESSAGGRARR